MDLAVNYSPQAAQLLREGDITFDLFKCPDWDDVVVEARAVAPLYVHFPLVTGRLDEVDFEGVERLLEQTDTSKINLHLYARPEDLPGLALNTRDPGDTARVTEWLIHEVERITARFGRENVIVENLIYRGHRLDMLRPAVLPEVICEVVGQTGCGFLLDVSHARISAYHLGVEEPGVDTWDYLSALPTKHLKELHVTGVTFHDEEVRDHFGFSETDWTVLEQVFGKIKDGSWATPDIAAFEWRSSKEVLARDVPRLLELVRFSGGLETPQQVSHSRSR